MAETRLIVPSVKNTRRSQFPSSLGIFSSNKSLFYDKLPSQPLRLSVLKLDASSFDIQVSKTATVAELKDAVEAVFSHMPQKGPAKISWPHVWGQFCLCYDGQKLIAEEDYLKNYGIKDGDQLRFVRHVSNNCGVRRKRSKKRIVVHLKQHRRCRSSQVNNCEPKENCDDDDIGSESSDEEVKQNGKVKPHIEEEGVGKSKLTGFIGVVFSYTPLAIVRKTTTKSRILIPSTIPRCLLGSFRKIRRIVCFGRRRHYSWRHTWRQ